MSHKIKIKHGINIFRYSISFLFVAFYLTIAFLFLFTDAWIDLIPEKRAVIGLILLGFAALRFYVSFRRYRGKKARINHIKKIKEEKMEEVV